MNLQFAYISTLFASLLSLLIVVSTSYAQSDTSSFSILNNKAARSVDKKFSSKRSSVLRQVNNQRDYSLSTAFRAETAQSVIVNNERSSGIFANYKAAAYLSYVRGVVDVGELLEYEEEDAAKKVFMLEGLRFSNEYVLQPLLGDFYNTALRELRAIRDKTTLSLVKSNSGDFDLSHGENAPKALLRFRIHASARNGLEPRVTFHDLFKLRLQPLERKILLELSFAF